jgi:hypothetical protein
LRSENQVYWAAQGHCKANPATRVTRNEEKEVKDKVSQETLIGSIFQLEK